MFKTVKKISVCFFTTLMLLSFFSFNVSASSVGTSSEAFTAPAGVTLTYRTRQRKKKWAKYKKQGAVAGHAAKRKKKLDAIRIKIKKVPERDPDADKMDDREPNTDLTEDD